MVAAVLFACSSDDKETCPIVGTYSVSGTNTDGDCPTSTDATAYTISPAPDGSGADYVVEITGIQGRCALNEIAACKAQGKCDLDVGDATDPANRTGTFQYSWTFSEGGFTGTATLIVPDAKSLPGGCRSSISQNASRQ